MDARLILAASEAGEAMPPVWRGAALLAALEEQPLATVGAMPVVRRDAALLRWRTRLFGAEVEAVAQCPACSETLEFAFAPSVPDAEEAGAGPSTADLDAALANDDPLSALAELTGDDPALAVPDEVALTCPACANEFSLALDPGVLLGEELRDAAARLLGEVVALARAFGWSEAAILALPPARRAAYLSALQT